MKNTLKTLVLLIVSLNSYNEPETVVTDIVRADGSVERRIEMKSADMKFGFTEVQIP